MSKTPDDSLLALLRGELSESVGRMGQQIRSEMASTASWSPGLASLCWA